MAPIMCYVQRLDRWQARLHAAISRSAAECRLQACRAHAQAGNNNNNSKHGSSANLMDDKSGGGQGGGVHRSGSAVSIASSVGSERSNSSGLYATFKPWC